MSFDCDPSSPHIVCVILQVYNKVDQISIEEVDRLARRPHSVVIRCVTVQITCHYRLCPYVCKEVKLLSPVFSACTDVSCGMKLNLDYLLERLWEYLALICIYTKKRGGTVTFTLILLLVCHRHVDMLHHHEPFSLSSYFHQSAQTLMMPSS